MAGFYHNLNQILGSLKRDQKGKTSETFSDSA